MKKMAMILVFALPMQLPLLHLVHGVQDGLNLEHIWRFVHGFWEIFKIDTAFMPNSLL